MVLTQNPPPPNTHTHTHTHTHTTTTTTTTTTTNNNNNNNKLRRFDWCVFIRKNNITDTNAEEEEEGSNWKRRDGAFSSHLQSFDFFPPSGNKLGWAFDPLTQIHNKEWQQKVDEC